MPRVVPTARKSQQERLKEINKKLAEARRTAKSVAQKADKAESRVKSATDTQKKMRTEYSKRSTVVRNKAAKDVNTKAFEKATTKRASAIAKRKELRSKVDSSQGIKSKSAKPSTSKPSYADRVKSATTAKPVKSTFGRSARRVLGRTALPVAAGVAGYELGKALGGEKLGKRIGTTLADNKINKQKIADKEKKLAELRAKTAKRKEELKAKAASKPKAKAKSPSSSSSSSYSGKAAKGYGIDLKSALERTREKRNAKKSASKSSGDDEFTKLRKAAASGKKRVS